jgi:transcriptional regulator with PAS, ATPase and Fis domain
VLVTGESGTGKELVARALHDLSARRNKPFVAVNCAAIPETLIESEIFGHEKGAFTGALERRAGCFELAEEGTLLLDEIGEMPAATQAKLLRVLEDRKLRRLGSKVETAVDVRVVAATNKDPEQAVANGELRGDLYYRLNVFNIQMPPLREHLMDVQAIADKMILDMNERHHCTVSGIKDNLLKRLEQYNWPGNVRELRNTIERATILAGSGLIGVEHLPAHFGEIGFAPIASRPRQPGRESGMRDVEAIKAEAQRMLDDRRTVHVEVGTTVNEAERQLILRTLDSTHNNKTKAAEILGISAKTLQNKLKEYSAADDGTE